MVIAAIPLWQSEALYHKLKSHVVGKGQTDSQRESDNRTSGQADTWTDSPRPRLAVQLMDDDAADGSFGFELWPVMAKPEICMNET